MVSKVSFHKGFTPLPLPPHYDPKKVGQVWKVPYQERAEQARAWAREQGISPALNDEYKIALIAIDVQNTFCLPEFELFVAGRSGMGAVEDNQRLCEFIYRNLGVITQIVATLDTHQALQIFHSIFLIDDKGEHPAPLTLISFEDVAEGRWRFNPSIASSLGISPEEGQAHLLHYARQLKERRKYDLTIWPYHAMLGGIGHALVAALEEAFFFHTIARNVQVDLVLKGQLPLVESYSAIGPEILEDVHGKPLAQKNTKFMQMVVDYDAVVIAGQAKSHCVAWTIDDLLGEIQEHDPRLAQKVYLLEDCTSPVVVPGVVDYTQAADATFSRFAAAGMHIVHSTDLLKSWPGISAN